NPSYLLFRERGGTTINREVLEAYRDLSAQRVLQTPPKYGHPLGASSIAAIFIDLAR
ncbi:MAG: hypothetical protein ACI9K2_005222, partial [Myxococcota bacterium]